MLRYTPYIVVKVSESEAMRRRVPLFLVSSTDHTTPIEDLGTGSGKCRVNKNFVTWNDSSASIVNVYYGWWYLPLTQAETDTVGTLLVRYSGGATIDPAYAIVQVVAYDPYDAAGLGLSRLDVTLSSRSSLTTSNVETAVGTVLNTAIAASPTADSVYERVKSLDDGVTATRAGYLDRLDAAVTTRATPAQVNAEMLDVLNVDTHGEPAAGAPPVTATLAAKLNFLYTGFRNRFTASNSERTLYADDAATVLCKSTVSDSGSLYDRGEMGAP